MVQMEKRAPAIQETLVQSLGLGDHLKKEIATNSSILDWRISWTEEPGMLQSIGSQKLDTTEQLSLIFKYCAYIISLKGFIVRENKSGGLLYIELCRPFWIFWKLIPHWFIIYK